MKTLHRTLPALGTPRASFASFASFTSRRALASLAVLTGLTLTSLSAFADRMPIPVNAPPDFKAECGSCHMAFPPALLYANDWKRVMSTLDKHYGDNASLDEPVRAQLEAFLVENASTSSKLGAAGGDPPRLTQTRRFIRKHDEISPATWKDKRVGSPANCVACHPKAEAGGFSEHEVTMPWRRGGV